MQFIKVWTFTGLSADIPDLYATIIYAGVKSKRIVGVSQIIVNRTGNTHDLYAEFFIKVKWYYFNSFDIIHWRKKDIKF